MDFPLPDPRFFAFHAASAKLVHATGLGNYLDDIMDDLEMSSVLSEDGSTPDLLTRALNMSAVSNRH